MKKYFQAVTLGAFSIRDTAKAERLISLIRGMGLPLLVLHFLFITAVLNFPVIFAIVRLPPHDLFTRILPEAVTIDQTNIDDFNMLMLESGYGRKIMLPILGMASGLVVILQGAFYLTAAFFLRLSRMVSAPMPLRERLGLLLFSSTLPVLLAALFGLYLPTVHIIVFYLAVILIGFQRSKLCLIG
jgi:hypothetical protein